MNIDEIRISPGNARTISDREFENLKKSITEFPKMMKLRPIIFNGEGFIIGGNQRYKALVELGYKEIPEGWAICTDSLTPKEVERFLVIDNVNFGNWDLNELNTICDLEELAHWGVNFCSEIEFTEDDFEPATPASVEPEQEQPEEPVAIEPEVQKEQPEEVERTFSSGQLPPERLFDEEKPTRKIMIMRITLDESDYFEALDILKGVSNDLGESLMEILRNR